MQRKRRFVKFFLRKGQKFLLTFVGFLPKLLHIEIQGYEEEEFPKRMFVYNYRIFDKFQKEVISLALLADNHPKFRPNEYGYSRWGFVVLCRYPLVKLID